MVPGGFYSRATAQSDKTPGDRASGMLRELCMSSPALFTQTGNDAVLGIKQRSNNHDVPQNKLERERKRHKLAREEEALKKMSFSLDETELIGHRSIWC